MDEKVKSRLPEKFTLVMNRCSEGITHHFGFFARNTKPTRIAEEQSLLN